MLFIYFRVKTIDEMQLLFIYIGKIIFIFKIQSA